MIWSILIYASLALTGMSHPSCLNESQNLDMSCKCGLASPDLNNPSSRIVDGYSPKPRPWMVKIAYHRFASFCGGSLINKRWVLSAGHCVCSTNLDLPCKIVNGQTVIDYLATERVRCLMEYNITRYNNEIQYVETSKIFVHPSYLLSKTDLALVQLAKAVTFSDRISPICLPSFEAFATELSGPAFVAGWGLMEEESNCYTGELGPDPFVQCAPFYVSKDGSHLKGCELTMPPPSIYDPMCTRLIEQMKLELFPAPGINYNKLFILNKYLVTRAT